MRLPWTLTVPAWAKQLQLKPVLCLGGCWHPGWLILGGKGNCASTVSRRFFKTLPATGQSSQLWAQLLPERNPAQPTGAAHQRQRHRVFCHRAWGWHSLALPEGSFFGQQEQKGHQNQGEERGLIFTAAALVWDLPGLFWSTLQGTHQALSRREFVPALWALCQLLQALGAGTCPAPPCPACRAPLGLPPSSLSCTIRLLMASPRQSRPTWFPPGPAVLL